MFVSSQSLSGKITCDWKSRYKIAQIVADLVFKKSDILLAHVKPSKSRISAYSSFTYEISSNANAHPFDMFGWGRFGGK